MQTQNKVYNVRVNRTQQRKLTSAQAVLAVLRHYRAFWENDEPLTMSVATLGPLLEAIKNLSPPESAPDDNATHQRDALDSIRRIGWFLSTQLVAYATATHQRQLKARIKYQKTEIVRGPRLATVARGHGLLACAREHLPSLARYQVDAAMLDRFADALRSLAGQANDRRQPVGERVPPTVELERLLTNLDELLAGQLDQQVGRFESAAPMFFHEFRSARTMGAGEDGANRTLPSGRRARPVRPQK